MEKIVKRSKFSLCLKVTGFSQETWKALGWIVPIMNTFKPYQVLSEIYKAGAAGCAGGNEWKKASGSRLLLVWWIFWIISHMILWGIAKQNLRSSFRDDLTLNQIISMSYGGIVICAISLIVAGFWFVVAGSLTRRLLGRSASVVTMAAPGNTELSADIEDQIYAQIADELDGRNLDKATWTKVYAESDGEDKNARSAYIKLRFERLMSGWGAQPKVVAELPQKEPPSRKILFDGQPLEWTAKTVIGIGVLFVVLVIVAVFSQPSTNEGTGTASGSKKGSVANQSAVEAPAPEAPALATAPPVDAQPAPENAVTSKEDDGRFASLVTGMPDQADSPETGKVGGANEELKGEEAQAARSGDRGYLFHGIPWGSSPSEVKQRFQDVKLEQSTNVLCGVFAKKEPQYCGIVLTGERYRIGNDLYDIRFVFTSYNKLRLVSFSSSKGKGPSASQEQSNLDRDFIRTEVQRTTLSKYWEIRSLLEYKWGKLRSAATPNEFNRIQCAIFDIHDEWKKGGAKVKLSADADSCSNRSSVWLTYMPIKPFPEKLPADVHKL